MNGEMLGALPVGTRLFGYAILGIIGHGGFGITYAAHNPTTLRKVTIKEFFPANMVRRGDQGRMIYSEADAETIYWALRKFEETTTALCALNHPNLPKTLDFVRDNDTGYMVMRPLEEGQTLERWLEERPAPPSLEELRPLFEPVMDALSYLHDRGLIHRDVAPDNILVTGEGHPVLFNFSVLAPEAGPEAIGFASRHYGAPEQMRAKVRPTRAADIYSMGAVLYRALSGTAPAGGPDRIKAIFEGRDDPCEPLMGLRPRDCPALAARAIDQALAVRPEQRQGSIAELRDALASPHPIDAPAPSSRLPEAIAAGGRAVRNLVRSWVGRRG